MPVRQHDHLRAAPRTALLDQIGQVGDVVQPADRTAAAAADAFGRGMLRTQCRTVGPDPAAAGHDFHDFLAMFRNAAAGILDKRHNEAVEIGNLRTAARAEQDASGRDDVEFL